MAKEYQVADKDHDDNLTIDELEAYMSNINNGNKTYDSTKIRELHRQIDESNDGKVTLDEFCNAFARKIETYELQILESKRLSAEIRYNIEDINNLKQDVARTETINQFGIMDGSVLIVTIVSAKDLRKIEFGRAVDPFVVLQCEGQRIESNFIRNNYNPVWNEKFTFDIKRGDDPLKISVYDRGTLVNSFIGKYMLNLDTLPSQDEIEQEVDLHEENYDSDVIKGRLTFKVQFIYSRLALMGDEVKELQIHKREIDNIRRAHERELNMIQSPFAVLFKDAQAGMRDEDDPEILLSIYQAHPKEMDASKILDGAMKPAVEKASFGEYFWQFLFVVAYFLFFLLTMALCFYKAEFINLVIC